jgi:UvrD-like helicase C-terminal domain/UvrD/REP helicase N-terminal domain
MLETFEKHPFANRIFNSKTDTHGETIEEVWEEYYTCLNNNNDADIIFPLHQSLLARNIYPQNYIKQEFDWIRSAFPNNEREKYINVDREGRFIPILEQDRKAILKALNGWDEKMYVVGAIDYLGLANALIQHIDKIKPQYRSILVDEVQDFGTLELKIIRKLCLENDNDLFICGDIAQQVYTKHHKIKQAGINILPTNFKKILKNYRNSREILEASYAVFVNNVSEDTLKSEEFEILNPEFANFSTPKPFLRRGSSLDSEFSSALEYLKDILDDKEKGCISICGCSIFDISKLGVKLGVPVLDGEMDLSIGNIFLSDLEQTKGFEFDRMVIVNCSKSVIPNSNLPKEEWYREISKLYVAMTRAKKELILSYSDQVADIFSAVEIYFTTDVWVDHLTPLIEINLPISFKLNSYNKTILQKTGKDFLYTKQAIGISRELQIKLLETVSGKLVMEKGGKKIKWRNLQELFQEVQDNLRDIPKLNRIFGPVVFKELESLVNTLKNQIL